MQAFIGDYRAFELLLVAELVLSAVLVQRL
jgi:hypothetical protein